MKKSNNIKRIMSVSMASLMLLAIPMNNAESAKGIPAGFDSARDYAKYFSSQRKQLKTRHDAETYRDMYLDHLYPETSTNGKKFNPHTIMQLDTPYYGKATDVEGNYKTSNGTMMYLGYAKDGTKITNMGVDEAVLRNPNQVWNIEGKNLTGAVRMELTEYNKTNRVGEMLVPEGTREQKKQAGRRLQERWVEEMVNRLPHYGGGTGVKFKTIQPDVDKVLNSVAIASPSTGRTGGLYINYFHNGAGRQTHRTMGIGHLDKVNFKQHELVYNNTTKELIVSYEIEGDDLVNGSHEYKII